MRMSGLQREVLALYRHCLRESRKKPLVSLDDLTFRDPTSRAVEADFTLQATRPHFESFAR